MLYWEVVPKVSPDGKLLPEMILVCNALRNDLTSPNEYIRGCMLRFLCKLKEHEILEPLIPSVKACLEHRHSYVRRNAALAAFSIHKSFGEQLLPDGPELIEKFIQAETDVSARRNAFLFLFNEAEDIAIDFLADHMDNIQSYGDGFALLVLELSRKVGSCARLQQLRLCILTVHHRFLSCRFAGATQLRSPGSCAACSSSCAASPRQSATRPPGRWSPCPPPPPRCAPARRPTPPC
jgi:vesicle coat complex subunit